MMSQILMIISLISIWSSLAMALIILMSAVHFWFKHSDFDVDTSPLPEYPMVTVVVPAHNEDVVIAQTAKAILDMKCTQGISLKLFFLLITVKIIRIRKCKALKLCRNMLIEI